MSDQFNMVRGLFKYLNLIGVVWALSLVGSPYSCAELEDDLPPALQNLERHSEVVLRPIEEKEQAIEAARRLAEESMKPIEVDRKTGAITRTLLLGHNRALDEKLRNILRKLQVPGDAEKYTIIVTANPTPNASINPEKALLRINIGLIAFTKNEDELASVIAHEMTHQNQQVFAAKADTGEVSKVLNEVPGYKHLAAAQREEIRADLGAVERLLKAGYNPWAQYDFERRATDLQGSMMDGKIMRYIYKKLFKTSFDYAEAHPAGEIRMQAVKAYLLDQGLKQDLSEKLTKKYTPFGPSLTLLRARANTFAKPLLSKWTQRGLMTISGAMLAHMAASSVGATDTAAFHAVTDALRPAWDSAGAAFNFTFGPVKEAWRSLPSLPDLPSAVQSAGRAAIDGLLYGALGGMGYIQTALPFYYMPHFAETEAWKSKLRIQARDKAVKRMQKELLDSIDDPNAINRLQVLLRYTQESINTLNDVLTNAPVHRFYRYLNGIHKNRSWFLNAQPRLVELLLNKIKELPPADQARELSRFMKNVVEPMEGSTLESKELRRFWKGASERIASKGISGLEKLNHRIQLLESAEASKTLSAEAAARLLPRLYEEGMQKTAGKLLDERYQDILHFTFSGQTRDPQLAQEVGTSLLRYKENAHGVRRGFFSRYLDDLKLEGRRLTRFSDTDLQKFSKLSAEVAVPKDRVWLPWKLQHFSALTSPATIHDAMARKELTDYLSTHFKSLSEVKKFIDQELLPKNFLADNMSRDFHHFILQNPQLIQSPEDLKALLDADYFFPKFDPARINQNSLEASFGDSLKDLSKRFPEVWRFEPSAANQLHSLYLKKAEELGAMPETPEEKLELWKEFTERGVTTTSDSLFTDNIDSIDGSKRSELENLAMKGRVWESDAKARIVDRDIRSSQEYQDLLSTPLSDVAKRNKNLTALIDQIQNAFPERGPVYSDMLERLSVESNSTRNESELIHAAKRIQSGARSEDLGLRVFSDLLERAHQWGKRDQWELIQFLRGDLEPTPRIMAEFAAIGPERIRRMYSLLPTLSRAGMLDSFIDSPRGLLPARFSTASGYASKIVDHLMRNASPKSKEVGSQLLVAFLHALEETGNKPLKSYILSYLLSLPPSATSSAGDILKNVLEVFGTTGVKLGQFLVASELLPPEESAKLRVLQEQAKVPERHSIYRDLADITRNTDLPLEIEDLKGAASMKYAIKATEKESRDSVILKVLRLDAVAHTNTEFKLLDSMSDFLASKYGKKYGVFKSIVNASKKAVEKELSLSEEVRKGKEARGMYRSRKASGGPSFDVPQEVLIDKKGSQRLIAAEFAEGTSIHSLPKEAQADAAEAILKMEETNLFSDENVVKFDPDRHAGNYRVQHLPGETPGVRVRPIDFGQWIEITRAQRDEVFNLFALSQILKKTGPTEWAASEIIKASHLDPGSAKQLLKVLKKYFPDPEGREVGSYFALLAALEETGAPRGIVYYDYVRAIIQLQQYEPLAGHSVVSPKKRLAEIVTDRANGYLSHMNMTGAEKFRFAVKNLPTEGWRKKARKACLGLYEALLH